jgi:O-antigen/teichoic acid export membrane protein
MGLLSPLAVNALANLVGRAWASIVAIALTPIYVAILGIEAYGLIGVFTLLQTILTIFDLGFGLTLNRRLSTLSADREQNAQLMRDTVRTFEALYLFVGAVVSTALVVTAPLLARVWSRASTVSTTETEAAIALMGIAIGMQWCSSLYLGGLLGLDRQVRANITLAAVATVRGLGAITVLHYVSPSMLAFFAWQIVAGLLLTLTLRFELHRALPRALSPAKFRATALRSDLRFAGALTGITALGTILTQLDKVVLSAIVPLEEFGYYVLAATVTTGLYIFVAPVFNAAFPRLVAALGRVEELEHTYHRASQMASVLLLPPAVALAVFAPEALTGWLGQAPPSTAVWLVRILAAGTVLNGLANLPYALMLAAGWTRLPLAMNLVAVATLIPALVLLSAAFGAIGAAAAWLTYNVGVALIGVPVMHRRLLRGHLVRWYVSDVGAPLLGTLSAVFFARIVLTNTDSRVGLIALFVAAVFAGAVGAWLLTPARTSLFRGLVQFFARGRRSSVEP